MAHYIEPDFKLLMLIHEMFSDGKKKEPETKHKKKKKQPHTNGEWRAEN